MPLEKLSAEDTFKRLNSNNHRIYPTQNRDVERLVPFAQPAYPAGFNFSPDSTIFATGSCFARNVEKSLTFIGANVVSSPIDIPAPETAEQVFQLYNKYTIHSILNELRWALSDEEVNHADLLIVDKKGDYYDLQVTPSKKVSGTLEEMTKFRAAYNASFAKARTADVVILTLGLVECWFDKVTGYYLNMAPGKALIDFYPGRFEFHLLDYNDILTALIEIHDLLHNGEGNPPKILVTVSPVGLSATFREHDVLVANMYSKSVQRAAVEAFVKSHEASYFPSYEYVALTDNKLAWGNKDFRHVRQETVDRIMSDVLLTYVGPSDGQNLLYTRGHATAYFSIGDFEKVVEIIEPQIDKFGDNADLLWLFAQSLRQVDRRPECIGYCRTVMNLDAKSSRAAGRTAVNTAKILKDKDLLEELKSEYVELFAFDAEWADTVNIA